MNDLVKAARGYIERLGFELVVQNQDKVPVAGLTSTQPTQDLERIDRAVMGCPGALLAARVGERHLVLDVDVRHDGEADLAKLLARYGAFPKTWAQQTPSGGFHIWFRHPGFKPRGRLANGIECLTGSRCITLSPSERAGGRYQWVEHPLRTELAEAPRWLIAAMQPPPVPQRPKTRSSDDPATREKRARAYMARFDGAVSGQHGSDRTIAAAVIVVRGFDLEESVAFHVLSEWNQKCDPPWSERELKRKLKEAAAAGRMEFGAMLVERTAA